MHRLLFVKSLLLFGLALVLSSAGCSRSVAPNPRIISSNVDELRKKLGGGAAEGGSTAGAAVAAEPTGWATIKGKFTLVGTAPGLSVLKIDKDQSVCAPGGKTVYSEEVVVDKTTMGIKDVVIYLTTKAPAESDKWEHADYAADKSKQVLFDQKNCVFLNHLFVMRTTQTMLIKNSDPVGHNTSISGSAGSKIVPVNVIIPASAETVWEPKGESAIPNPVSCTIHPWMSALVLTRSNPYYAVTDAQGNFEIKNVPAGVDLEFAVWQQGSSFITTANVNGTDEKWNKGRFKRKFENDATVELDVKVADSLFKK